MTQENINLLSLSEFYKVISTKTNNVYIAADNSCYLFDNTMDATEFIKKVPNTTLSEIELLKPSIFVTDMYNLGIEKINIKKGTEDQFTTIEITKDDCKKKFFNNITNRNILHLLQTGDKQYLKNLKSCKFICPVFIKMRFPKQYSSLHYACAKKDEKKYYILFTTMEEFERWNELQENKYKPLEVDFVKESSIRRKESIIINPLSNKLIINDNSIKYVIKAS